MQAYMKLVKLMLFLLFVAHFTALSFYGCAVIETKYGVPRTWADIDDLPNQEWYIQYIHR